MMDRIWYIDIAGKQEGPYSFEDLRGDHRITPDTFVWREGWTEWRRMREVSELKDLFKDENPPEEQIETVTESNKKSLPGEGELVIDYRQDPPYLFWFLTAIIILVYMIIQLYWK